jgi:hypothetical protein
LFLKYPIIPRLEMVIKLMEIQKPIGDSRPGMKEKFIPNMLAISVGGRKTMLKTVKILII